MGQGPLGWMSAARLLLKNSFKAGTPEQPQPRPLVSHRPISRLLHQAVCRTAARGRWLTSTSWLETGGTPLLGIAILTQREVYELLARLPSHPPQSPMRANALRDKFVQVSHDVVLPSSPDSSSNIPPPCFPCESSSSALSLNFWCTLQFCASPSARMPTPVLCIANPSSFKLDSAVTPRSLSYTPTELVHIFPRICITLDTSQLEFAVQLSPCSWLAPVASPSTQLRALHRAGVREHLWSWLAARQLSQCLELPLPSGTGSWTLLRYMLVDPTHGTQLCTTPLRSTSTAW